MDWNAIGTEFILSLIGLMITVLGSIFTLLISKYIKNDKIKKTVASLHELVRDSVLNIYQTYVEEMKEHGMFSREAQKEALERCFELIKTNMPQDVKTWLEANFSDLEGYLKSLIESQIGMLKNEAKKGN